MTDFTTDTPMMEAAARPEVATIDKVRKASPPKREYYAYFTIIFLAALPLSFLTWLLAAGRQMAIPAGPSSRLEPGAHHHADDLYCLIGSLRLRRTNNGSRDISRHPQTVAVGPPAVSALLGGP